jgi:hypothetical protein
VVGGSWGRFPRAYIADWVALAYLSLDAPLPLYGRRIFSPFSHLDGEATFRLARDKGSEQLTDF